MANDLTFTQISTILTDITKQATGNQKILAPINTAQFVTVAQTALLTGYDNLIKAISQVLSKTIFSIRPYSAKFKGLDVSQQRFGAITRKLQISDGDWEDDQEYNLVDGQSVDMYVVKKPNVLQTNFYGATQLQKHITRFKNQLDVAFTSPDQLAQFVTMYMQNASDTIEQGKEVMRRSTLANFIGGKYLGDPDSCYHLITEYNAVTGLALDHQSVYQPENFSAFMKWAFARIAQITEMMTERTLKFHTNINGKPIMRHTPLRMQRVYIYAPARYNTEAMVLSDTFHPSFLNMSYNESVNFWQNVDDPEGVEVQPVYMLPTGALTEGAATKIAPIFGVIFDEEAVGITTVNQWQAATPFNAAGGYSNIFWHYTVRYWNDFTENGALLLLD